MLRRVINKFNNNACDDNDNNNKLNIKESPNKPINIIDFNSYLEVVVCLFVCLFVCFFAQF